MMIKKLLQTVWPAITWSVIIFILLIIPGRDLPPGPGIPHLDKVIHIILFGTQVWLWIYYINYGAKFPRLLWIFFLIFILSCSYGIGMEYYQKYLVVNRGFEWGDIVADITGSGLGWLWWMWKFKQQKGL